MNLSVNDQLSGDEVGLHQFQGVDEGQDSLGTRVAYRHAVINLLPITVFKNGTRVQTCFSFSKIPLICGFVQLICGHLWDYD